MSNKKGLSRPVLRASIHSERVGVGVAPSTCTFKFEEGKTRRLGRVQTMNEEKHVVMSLEDRGLLSWLPMLHCSFVNKPIFYLGHYI